jgi:RNA polymerase sigma-70 factor (ECF subfamily)
MGDPLLTRASLLARLRDPLDSAAWRQFVELYGGLVYSFARQRGLQDADAADLTQEVFLAVAQAAGRFHYDPRQGKFRGWLYGVTRNQVNRFLHRRRAQPVGSGDSNVHERLTEVPSRPADTETLWEQEYHQQLFRMAAAEIRDNFSPTTWKAFWTTAVDGKPSADAATELGLSLGAVYVARSRVLAQLTEQVRRMQGI